MTVMGKYSLFIFLGLVILVRYNFSTPNYKNGDKIRVATTLGTEPYTSNYEQIFKTGNLTAYLPRFPEIHYGDHIVLEGKVVGKTLRDVKLISIRQSNSVFVNFRYNLVNFWRKALPEPHSSLVAGITLGVKSGLSQDFWDSLKKTGTTHVVVASGMNVAFVAGFTMSVLVLIVRRKIAAYLAIAGIFIYCLLVGFEAPIVRAAIMGSLVFLAQATGRVSNTLKILFMSALLMLIIKPAWLTDLGFILSFSATTSLILFEKEINSFIHYVPGIFRESLSTSLAAQILVAPILFVTFGYVSILSPVVNVLVLWVVPLIMIISSIGGIIGLVVPEVGLLIMYLCYPLTSWFIWIVNLFANIS